MVVNRPHSVFDLNGDGLPDLAIGAPSEDVGAIADAGTVTVLYGAPDGTYGRTGSLAISQESVGQRSETGDRFGAAIVLAEVTGDAYVDLVIGAPGEDRGAGQVVVVHGSRTGITGTKRTVLQQGRAGAAGAAEAGDGFGSAISVGDGLWIGAPGEDLGRATNAGTATVFQIKPVRTAGSIQHQQGARRVPGTPESGDRFGAAIAGGGTLIGVPGEDIGRITDAGLVAWNLTHTLTQATSGVPGDPEQGDQFGASVAAAITDATDEEARQPGEQVTPELLDLISIGAPGEDVGAVKDAGAGHADPGQASDQQHRSCQPGQRADQTSRTASAHRRSSFTATRRPVERDRHPVPPCRRSAGPEGGQRRFCWRRPCRASALSVGRPGDRQRRLVRCENRHAGRRCVSLGRPAAATDSAQHSASSPESPAGS